LWNHGPRMWSAQTARQIQPALDSRETADLFAYFYSVSYFRSPGNPAIGARLFEEKTCASCHQVTVGTVYDRSASVRGREPLQSPISTWTNVDDPLVWAEYMWNHSGKVFNELARTGTEWPHFSTQEM